MSERLVTGPNPRSAIVLRPPRPQRVLEEEGYDRDFRGVSRPFSLVYPSAPKRSAATRALIDHLLAHR